MAGEPYSTFARSVPALVLPVLPTDIILVTRGGVAYSTAPTLNDSYTYVEPTAGQTLTATAGLGAFVLNPGAAPLVGLTVVMPPSPRDGQVFEVSTSQDITGFTPAGNAGQSIFNTTPFTLAADGGASWRWIEGLLTWFRRY